MTPLEKRARFWFRYYHQRIRRLGSPRVYSNAHWQAYYVDAAKRSFEGCDRLAIRFFYRSPTALKYALRWHPFRHLDPKRLP